jgi:hypothetical protein
VLELEDFGSFARRDDEGTATYCRTAISDDRCLPTNIRTQRLHSDDELAKLPDRLCLKRVMITESRSMCENVMQVVHIAMSRSLSL